MQTESLTCASCGKAFSIKFAVRPKSTACPACKKRVSLAAPPIDSTTQQDAAAHRHVPRPSLGMNPPSEYDRASKRLSRRIAIVVAAVAIYLVVWGISFLNVDSVQNFLGPIGWRVRAIGPFTYSASMIVKPDLRAGFTQFAWAPNELGERFCFAYDGRGDLFSYGGDSRHVDTRSTRGMLLFRPDMFRGHGKELARVAALRRQTRSNFFRDAVADQASVWLLIRNPDYDSLHALIWIADEKTEGIIQALQELSGMGVDIQSLRLWKDRQVLADATTDDILKQWLLSERTQVQDVTAAHDVDDRIVLAKQSVTVLSRAVELFRNDCGEYPSMDMGLNALVRNPGIAAWNGPYINVLKPDPWGTAYQYTVGSEGVAVISLGPDRVRRTSDDVYPDKTAQSNSVDIGIAPGQTGTNEYGEASGRE